MGEFITVSCDDGEMGAYLALPAAPNGAGVVLAMSVWGVNSDLKAWAEFLAGLGYAVLAPNLFWRQEAQHGIDYDFAKFDRVAELMNGETDERGIADLMQARSALMKAAPVKAMGMIGWCYGGRIACLCGVGPEFQAIVGVYPTTLETRLDIAPHLVTPLSLHLPEIEQYGTTEDSIAQIVRAFAGNPEVESFVYAGVKHGFGFTPPHPNYDVAAARLTDARVAIFLDKRLAP